MIAYIALFSALLSRLSALSSNKKSEARMTARVVKQDPSTLQVQQNAIYY